jgi:hypothetical protein
LKNGDGNGEQESKSTIHHYLKNTEIVGIDLQVCPILDKGSIHGQVQRPIPALILTASTKLFSSIVVSMAIDMTDSVPRHGIQRGDSGGVLMFHNYISGSI